MNDFSIPGLKPEVTTPENAFYRVNVGQKPTFALFLHT